MNLNTSKKCICAECLLLPEIPDGNFSSVEAFLEPEAVIGVKRVVEKK